MKQENTPLDLSGTATHKQHKVGITISFDLPIDTVDISKELLKKISIGKGVYYQGKPIDVEENLDILPKSFLVNALSKSGILSEDEVLDIVEKGKYVFEVVQTKIIKKEDLKNSPYEINEISLTAEEIKSCTKRLADEIPLSKKHITHIRTQTEEFICLGCGCTDSCACEEGCSWLAIDPNSGFGICSSCKQYLDQFMRGDKEC